MLSQVILHFKRRKGKKCKIINHKIPLKGEERKRGRLRETGQKDEKK